ncbi:MAG: hypothetical protein ACRD3G_14565 [Vicinamibacterales bacterium]
MKRHLAVVSLLVVAAGIVASADTLVLTNGRRIPGELLGVYGREIEFEERSGFGRRIVRVPRAEIDRIEFVDDRNSRDPVRREDGRRDDGRAVPARLRERNVQVNPNQPWTDTGIDLRNGQEVYFETSGQVTWSPNRRVDADGTRNSKPDTNRPLPERNSGALIGRIGERDIFFIGTDVGPFRVRGNGRLYLGVNDDRLDDNTGGYRVVVSY